MFWQISDLVLFGALVDKLIFESVLKAHPASSILKAYQARELPEAEAGKVLDHLIVCKECTLWILGWAEYKKNEPLGELRASLDVASAWQSLQVRLYEEAQSDTAEESCPEALVRVPSCESRRVGFWRRLKFLAFLQRFLLLLLWVKVS